MDRDQVEALRQGNAFVDLSWWRKVEVSGSDAVSWLNDLVSADIAGLRSGGGRRSLLLSPTGAVQAEFTVAMPDDSLILVQDPAQPRSILELLAPYILSSDVELTDRTDELALFSLPGASGPDTHEAPIGSGAARSSPSCLGRGTDVVAPAGNRQALLFSFSASLIQAGNEDLETWRILEGQPRVGVDVLEGDLPQEARLEDAVAFDKGCYLGQEAVARVRNLGHPRRLLLHLVANPPVSPGDPVLTEEGEVGEITSAAPYDGRVVVLARVRWMARGGPLRTALGSELTLLDRA